MTNLIPSDNLKVGDDDIILVHKYKYLSYEIQIARDLKSRITLAWAAFEIFKSNISNHPKKTYLSHDLRCRNTFLPKPQQPMGLTLRDRVRNEEIIRTVVTDVIKRIASLKWKCGQNE